MTETSPLVSRSKVWIPNQRGSLQFWYGDFSHKVEDKIYQTLNQTFCISFGGDNANLKKN